VAEWRAAMSAGEWDLWRAFYLWHGFAADRIEAAVAGAGAYLGGLWDGKADAAALTPRFRPKPQPGARVGNQSLLLYLTSIPGAVVRRHGA